MFGRQLDAVGRIAPATLVISLLLAIPGWTLGFRSASAYAWFWLLLTLLALDVWTMFRRFFTCSRLHDAVIRLGVLTFAVLVACGLVLGFLHAISIVAYAGALLLLWIGLNAANQSQTRVPFNLSTSLSPWHPVVLLIFPVLVFVCAFGLVHPPVGYDSLTYHLFFPARWLQAGQLTIVPTPFGDQAPAYAPSNAELAYLWMMLPFHGDLIARVGQFPFYVLCGVCVYGLADALGFSRNVGLYSGALFLVAKPIVDQAVGADVDLTFAALLLATIYFGLRTRQEPTPPAVLLLGIGAGLCLGTKFLGVAYVPLLLPFLLAPEIRRHALLVVPGILLLAAPWYVRNWIVAGSPLYPMGLTVAGITIAPGAWGHESSLNNWAHLTDMRLLPGLLKHGVFGDQLFVIWLPIATVGIVRLVLARRWVAVACTLVAPATMAAIYWYVLPFNDATDTRYLFGGLGLALLLIPAAFDGWSTRFAHVVLGAGLVWLIALSTDRLLSGWPLVVAAAVAVGGPLSLWFGRSRFDRAVATALVVFSVAVSLTSVGSARACPPVGCPLVSVSLFDRPTMFEGWAWIEKHVADANIAYSGNNVPYRLLGSHLQNRVYYVNVNGHYAWRYDDYERAERGRSDYVPPQRPNSPVFRHRASFDDWLQNLKRQNIAYVFLTRMSELMEADYLRDDAGFPVENTWAEAHPELFERVFENPEVRIFRLRE